MKIAASNGSVPSLSMFTPTPSPTVTNSRYNPMPSTTPEQTLAQLKAVKDEIAHLLKIEGGLKQEMENHFAHNKIRGKFVSQGVMAVRQRREGKWAYSEFTQQFILDKKRQVEDQMAMEREDGIARQNEPTFYWAIREEKNDK
tara:strand:- start:33 stop:461 length:429 start_codon:yes stop_codon:yes gene_type:complete